MNDERVFRLDEVEPKGVLIDLIQNLWVVVLTMVSFVMLASVFFQVFYTSKYTSEATIAIVDSSQGTSYAANNTYSGLATATGMAEALCQVFESDILMDSLEMNLGYEPLGDLKVSQIENTNLVLLQMTADTDGEAYKELQLVLENYEQFSDYIFSNARLLILSEPSMPGEPSNQISPLIYGSCAAVLGFLLCILYITVVSVMRRTVKNKLFAERWLNAKVYGVIGHERKKGLMKRKKNQAILISNPICSFSYEEAFSRLTSRIIFHMETEGEKVLLITSGSENEGKSTVVSNIGLSMAKRGKKVLIIDTDFRKPALYKIFDYRVENYELKDIRKYIKGEVEAEQTIIKDKRTGLYFALCQHTVESPELMISSDRLNQFIQSMKQQFDYVVMDSPPAGFLGDAELLAERADAAIFVVRRDFTHINQINDALNNMKNSGIDLLGCVLNDMYSDVSSKNMNRLRYKDYRNRKFGNYEVR